MDGTILSQGSFTVGATVANQVIAIPSGVDWMRVINYTQKGTVGGAAAVGNEFYWQRGMAAGTGTAEYYTNGSTAVNGDTLVSGGFTLYDPTGQTPGALSALSAPINFTAITNATRPVISTASTAGLAVGSVVRLSPILVNGTTGTAVISDLAGIDFVVGTVVANTSFTLLTAASAFNAAPGITSGTGSWRIVNYPPYFYPRRLYITNINTTTSVVSTATAHGLTPGQEVRFNIPSISGITQLNPTTGNLYQPAIVTVVNDAYDFTVNINMTGFTAFTYPTVAQMPGSFPEVTPIGEDTATALLSTAAQTPLDWNGLQVFNSNTGILADSTINSGFLGMILGTGGLGTVSGAAIAGPAGSATADVVYWTAGKSSFGGL